MIKYSNEEGFIRPKGIKFRDGQNADIKLPKVAVGVFSHHLYEDVIEKFECMEVGYLSCANMERNVYILKYNDTEITFFLAGVSGPWIVADIEELHASGVEKVIIFGNCGVLDNKIEDCSIIIPTKGFRDEGTSYHYVDANEVTNMSHMFDSCNSLINFDSTDINTNEVIDMNPKYVDDFVYILNEYNFDYTKGYTWTTDAIYRETKEKIKYFKDNGCVCVEMEGTVIAAVCNRLNMDYFTFYYAGDNLDSTVWDERSLSGLVKIDKKKEVMTLALNLAHKLSK